MSDDDRLADYFARNRRTLDDGCDSCDYSLVYCHAVKSLDNLPCCESCSHT